MTDARWLVGFGLCLLLGCDDSASDERGLGRSGAMDGSVAGEVPGDGGRGGPTPSDMPGDGPDDGDDDPSLPEPTVKLDFGTQTGGSGDFIDCGDGEWEDTDEPPQDVGAYEGAVQLRLWMRGCEEACRAAGCARRCPTQCYQNPAPPGNARLARLEVDAIGPLQRWVAVNAEGEPLCAHNRRFEAQWELGIDGVLTAQGAGFSYSGEFGAMLLPVFEDTEFQLAPGFTPPGPTDPSGDDGGVAGDHDGGAAGEREPHVRGVLEFRKDEVLVGLSWVCEACDGLARHDLVTGVLQHPGAEVAPAPPSTLVPTWRWPAAECVEP